MKTLLLPFAFLFSIASFAQTGYDVKFQIKNNTDTTMYLVRTIFDKQYISDTCKKVKNGLVQFKGKKTLDKGVYTLVSQEKSVYFDFLINDSYNFTISFDRNDIVNTLKSNGSKENEDMFAYLKFMTNKNAEFIKAKEDTKKMNKADSAKFVKEKFDAMTKDDDMEDEFVEALNPNLALPRAALQPETKPSTWFGVR